MALVHDSIDDFILFPRDPPHFDMAHEESYNGMHFGANVRSDPQQQHHPDSSSYDAYPALSVYSPASQLYYNAPHYPFEASKSQVRSDQRYTPAGSPSPSISHAFDHPPSMLSSASGASVQSTASSAVGSPYSHATQSLPGQDQWTESQHGLGIARGIIHNDGFGNDGMYSLSGVETDTMCDDSKLQGSFVGESRKISSSSSGLQPSSPVSTCSASQSYTSVTSPLPVSMALDTSLGAKNLTIDSILEEANNRITSPSQTASPTSANSAKAPSDLCQSAHRISFSPAQPGPFRSPTMPASAMSPRVIDRGWQSGQQQRGIHSPHIVAGNGRRIQRTSASPTNRFTPYSWPMPQTAQNPSPSVQSQNSFFTQSSDPSLIQPFNDTPITHNTTSTPFPGVIHAFHLPSQTIQPPSPAPSDTSSQDSHHPGPSRYRSDTRSPYLHSTTYRPYPTMDARRMSIASSQSRHSHESSRSASIGFEDDGRERGRCPNPDCGRVFKDLKAHMLTHQSERPEKCPIVTCEYHQKGFARKYDKNRHTLTHYKGTMVCDFCPGSGSAAEKSFNRADVFKRHLTSVHGVEQTPPNSRKKSPSASTAKKSSTTSPAAAGKCSTCSAMFHNAQDFYEHLDDCVLRVVQQEEPSEAINEQRLAEVVDDPAVQESLDRQVPTTLQANTRHPSGFDESEVDADGLKEENVEDSWPSLRNGSSLSGKGVAPHVGGGNSIAKSGRTGKSRGMTFSKGGVPLVAKGRKRRKFYPPSWGCSADKMKMKKRVLCAYDGPRRLCKDDMMLDNEFEVRMRLGDGNSYVTDLDVETVKRANAFHDASVEEKGPWLEDEVDIQQLMSSELSA